MKYQIATAITASLLAGTSAADPNVDRVADLIAKVAPSSTACDTSNAECRTNVQVAPHMLDAFMKYGIYSNGAVAAVVALTAFESGSYEFKLSKTPAPGTPGKGTANMQSWDFNVQYAQSIPELQADAALSSLPADVASASDEQKNALLAALTDDKYNFASGAWYLTKHCDPKYVEALGSATDAAWSDYITTCVGTPDTPERDALWKAAKSALGVTV